MLVTPEQVEQFKKDNPKGVWELRVEDKIGYIRKPTREEMKSAMSLAASDPLGMAEDLLSSCWLGGDDELKEDDDYFYGAASQLQSLIEIKQGELKKL